MATIRDQIQLPTKYGAATLFTFNDLSDQAEHIAVRFGNSEDQPALVRVHSECLTGDVLGSLRCDCGPQLDTFLQQIAREKGWLVYLRQEGRGIGLYNKIAAYRLQEQGLDTFQANRLLGFKDDERRFSVAGEILKALSISAVRLVTNNPDKVKQLEQAGVQVAETVHHRAHVCKQNYQYMAAKQKQGHILLLEAEVKNVEA